jgi:hypothetical protein
MQRGTFVIRDGGLVDKKTGAAMAVPDGPIRLPFVMRDTPAYASPIDGRIIEGRVARREDLKRNGCIEVEPGMFPNAPQGFRDEKLARKFKAIK